MRGSKLFYLEGMFELLPGAPCDSCEVELLHIDAWGLGLPENVGLMLSLQMIPGTILITMPPGRHPLPDVPSAPSGLPVC